MNDEIDKLIDSLKGISPMPSDDVVTNKQLDQYNNIINQLSPFMDERCIEPLIQSFGYGYGSGVYWNSVHLLEKFDTEITNSTLITSLQSPNPGSRMWAAVMLGRRENVPAIPSLISLLNDKFELIRAEAVDALGDFDRDDIRERLLLFQKTETSSEVLAALRTFL